MRVVNVNGRPFVLTENGGIDVVSQSLGKFSTDVNDLVARWGELAEFVSTVAADRHVDVDLNALSAPVPWPRQVFAVGLNYREHAAEAGRAVPKQPAVFTKYPTCLTGPTATVHLPSGRVDWEVEQVVVIGRRAEHVSEERAWDHVAGMMVGQDLSERDVQRAGPVPQFSLGKSFPGFGPTGPALVSLDEIADRDALSLGCELDGELVQSGSTKDLVFSVPELVAYLSSICPLLPGDLIFTGTPAGVGVARDPQRFIAPGQTLRSWIDSVGELSNTFTGG